MKLRARIRDDRGFSLIEVLVALAVTGLISSAAAGVTILMSRVQERAAARLELMDKTFAASRLIRTMVEKAVPDLSEGNTRQGGSLKEVRLLTQGPTSLLLAQPLLMTLKVEQEGPTQTLSAHWLDPESGEALEEKVLTGAKDISFSYFVIVDEAGRQAWRSSWQIPEQLPSGVLMRFHYPALGEPIDIVVRTLARMPEACILLPAEKACRYGPR